jgi:periplasmic divalent cation tolerance protein
VLTGTSSRAEAQAIVEAAIAQRRAAAAQVIGPIASAYRWEGVLTHADEWLRLLKTGQGSQRSADRAHSILA